jgi:hypothetical protein
MPLVTRLIASTGTKAWEPMTSSSASFCRRTRTVQKRKNKWKCWVAWIAEYFERVLVRACSVATYLWCQKVREWTSERHAIVSHVWPIFNPSTIVNPDIAVLECFLRSLKTRHRTQGLRFESGSTPCILVSEWCNSTCCNCHSSADPPVLQYCGIMHGGGG